MTSRIKAHVSHNERIMVFQFSSELGRPARTATLPTLPRWPLERRPPLWRTGLTLPSSSPGHQDDRLFLSSGQSLDRRFSPQCRPSAGVGLLVNQFDGQAAACIPRGGPGVFRLRSTARALFPGILAAKCRNQPGRSGSLLACSVRHNLRCCPQSGIAASGWSCRR